MAVSIAVIFGMLGDLSGVRLVRWRIGLLIESNALDFRSNGNPQYQRVDRSCSSLTRFAIWINFDS